MTLIIQQWVGIPASIGGKFAEHKKDNHMHYG